MLSPTRSSSCTYWTHYIWILQRPKWESKVFRARTRVPIFEPKMDLRLNSACLFKERSQKAQTNSQAAINVEHRHTASQLMPLVWLHSPPAPSSPSTSGS